MLFFRPALGLAALSLSLLAGCGGGGTTTLNNLALPGSSTLSGTVSGLPNGASLILKAAGQSMTIATNGAFNLPTSLAGGSAYTVTIGTQPAGENCTVTGGSGTVGAANNPSIGITCVTATGTTTTGTASTGTFTIGGTVAGLASGDSVVLDDNGGDALTISTSGAFMFATALASGSQYAVTIGTQPTDANCVVTSGAGTVSAANVTNVAVTCTAVSIGGTVAGLTSGASLVLEVNGADPQTVSAGGTFTLPSGLAVGDSYSVTVSTPPAGQACSVAGGTGTVTAATVANVVITCVPLTFTIGGTVAGLAAAESVVLDDNGGDALTVSASGNFTFPTPIAFNGSYAVTVGTPPAGQTCSVAGGVGTVTSANIANVVVTCSNQAFTLGGTIQGLNGAGLVLANGTDTVTVPSGATSFTLPTAVAYTSSYAVTVQTQPPGLACAVTAGTGTMPAQAVTAVSVSCTDQPFTVGGTVSGLGANSGLVLANGSNTYAVPASATSFVLPTPVNFSSPYAVTVQSAPAGLTCTLINGSGTMPASNVTNLAVTCAYQSYTIGGTVSGLTASGLVLANGSDTLTVAANATSFTMPTSVAYTSAYALVVQSAPAYTNCTIVNGSGTMGTAPVTNIAVTCAPVTYTVGGSISGLGSSSGLTLANGSDTLSVLANATAFTMPTGVANGSTYNVTVAAHPVLKTCSVSNGSGTIAGANVSNVGVGCSAGVWSLFYSFAGPPTDGQGPFYEHLTLGSDGNFYGTTNSGGAHGYGTIFKITPSANETLLYSFSGGTTDGSHPQGSLVIGSDGNFYGTTPTGGAHNYGTVFKITPTGAETVLHSFSGGPADGQGPQGSLTLGSDGNFYGTTDFGGSHGYGTVFKITPNGNESVLYSFGGGTADGANPFGNLVQGSDGNFYGMTQAGGPYGINFHDGTVFKITPTGTETVLHFFSDGTDGKTPQGSLVQGSDGNFYGMTTYGGSNNDGIVFKIDPSGNETILHTFAGTSDGATPTSSLIQGSDGNFYGTADSGGAHNWGTLFQITPTGSLTVLWSFTDGSDGGGPLGDVIFGPDGTIYGTTGNGGIGNKGVVFSYN